MNVKIVAILLSVLLVAGAVVPMTSAANGKPFDELWKVIEDMEESFSSQVDSILVRITSNEKRIDGVEEGLTNITSTKSDDVEEVSKRTDELYLMVNNLSERMSPFKVVHQVTKINGTTYIHTGAYSSDFDKKFFHVTEGNHSECPEKSYLIGGGATCVYGEPMWNHVEERYGNRWHAECLSPDGVLVSPLTTHVACIPQEEQVYLLRVLEGTQRLAGDARKIGTGFVMRDFKNLYGPGSQILITTNETLVNQVMDVYRTQWDKTKFYINEETNEIRWVIEE